MLSRLLNSHKQFDLAGHGVSGERAHVSLQRQRTPSAHGIRHFQRVVVVLNVTRAHVRAGSLRERRGFKLQSLLWWL